MLVFPHFIHTASVGTEIAKGKPVEEFEGKKNARELWLKADFALIKAELGDQKGNLTYRMAARNFNLVVAMAARNFNPVMAMAATTTIAQVSSIVALGDVEPENVVTPGIFVGGLVAIASPAHEESLNRQNKVYSTGAV